MRRLPIPKTEGVAALVAFLEWLGVSNAEQLPQNGVLDEQVEAAMAEVKAKSIAHVLTSELNTIAILVGDHMGGKLITYGEWSHWHDSFLQRLKEGAAKEKRAELTEVAHSDQGWPSTAAVG